MNKDFRKEIEEIEKIEKENENNKDDDFKEIEENMDFSQSQINDFEIVEKENIEALKNEENKNNILEEKNQIKISPLELGKNKSKINELILSYKSKYNTNKFKKLIMKMTLNLQKKKQNQ